MEQITLESHKDYQIQGFGSINSLNNKNTKIDLERWGNITLGSHNQKKPNLSIRWWAASGEEDH